ncbi:response regulator [Labrys sp. KB_33_2]|uniref:response regulator n=1 Tax=Labrys sp. KB_33_2 TaxID=3237479 RepID=UPI003F9398F5
MGLRQSKDGVMERALRVLLADDHAIVREGVKGLLATLDKVAVVGEAASAEALLALVRETPADLLLLDLGMPGVSGIQVITEVQRLAARLKVLVLTANVEPRTVRAAFDAGACGYLTKDGDPMELADALQAVAEGGTYLAASLRFALGDGAGRVKPPAAGGIVSPIPLTQRERQILLLAAQGLTAREVAGRLGIQYLTARKHRENLMRKLDLHNVAELAAYAVRLGLPVG